MPKKKTKEEQLDFIRELGSEYEIQLPDFASTPDEIKRAVEKNAINRGSLLIQIIVSLNVDDLLNIINELSKSYDKEEIIESCNKLGIDLKALQLLDEAKPPIPYPFYFCSWSITPNCFSTTEMWQCCLEK